MTEPNTGFRYKAFISYSWKDKDAAGGLHRALEAFRTPKALVGRKTQNGPAPERLAPIFRDRDEEAAGASLKAAIEEGLDNSEFLIIVCSPNAAASPWVNKEISYFRKKRTPDNILSYVIAGAPGPHCFAPALLFESTVDGVIGDQPIEQPLAADAREEGNGKRLARLKIAAAMLGVGLDDLVRRDAQRRARRLYYVLAGVSAVAFGFAGIAATAVFQWRQAVENEQRATREAMKASRTAEFMVSLFEVVDPGEARGREVTAKEILDKGVKTIETGLADEPDVQASLMHTMGRVYTGLGLYPDAARILGVARDKRVAIMADPDDVFATENALARAEFEKGDLGAAKKIYSRLVAQADADIAKGKWRADFATALTGMGETTLYADTPEEAQPYYERARDLLAAHGLGESEEMAEALRGLAGALSDQRKFGDAERLLLRAKKMMVELGPEKYYLSLIANDLAYVFYMEKNFESAKSEARDVLKINETILGGDHPDTLIAANNLARYEFETGDIQAAQSRMLNILKHEEKIKIFFEKDFSFFVNTMGEIESTIGENDQAIKYFNEALSILSGQQHRLIGPVNINLGRSLCDIGDRPAGIERIARGRGLLKEFYDNNDWRYGVADEFESRCRAVISEREKARNLAKAGYERLQEQLGDEHYFTQRAKKWMDGLEK